MMSLPRGQRDYSTIRLSRHALERFVERFAAEPASAANEFRGALARTRRLGRNPHNGAIAVLGLYRNQVMVAIVQKATCMTVLTWNQFLPQSGRVRPRQAAAQVGASAAEADDGVKIASVPLSD